MDILTIEQAAEMLGYSTHTLRNLRFQNRGPLSFKWGAKVYYRRGDVEDYLEKRAAATARGGNL